MKKNINNDFDNFLNLLDYCPYCLNGVVPGKKRGFLLLLEPTKCKQCNGSGHIDWIKRMRLGVESEWKK